MGRHGRLTPPLQAWRSGEPRHWLPAVVPLPPADPVEGFPAVLGQCGGSAPCRDGTQPVAPFSWRTHFMAQARSENATFVLHVPAAPFLQGTAGALAPSATAATVLAEPAGSDAELLELGGSSTRSSPRRCQGSPLRRPRAMARGAAAEAERADACQARRRALALRQPQHRRALCEAHDQPVQERAPAQDRRRAARRRHAWSTQSRGVRAERRGDDPCGSRVAALI